MCDSSLWDLLQNALVAGVTLFGVLLTLRSERRREEDRFKRERVAQAKDLRRHQLEELYQAVEHQRTAVSSLMVGALSIAANLPRPEEVVKYDTSKLAMLVGIYLPSVQPLLDEMMTKLDAHGLAMVKFATGKGGLETAHNAANDFQKAAQALQVAIAEAARHLVETT